jgi:signal transduction histidine kinase
MPNGGCFTIEAEQRGEALEIAFRDEGIGMTEEQLEKYFQPFLGRFPEGAGLGGAIVYRIVEEHGGTIGLRSRQGEGTEVLITLPLACRWDRQTGGAFRPIAATGTMG